MGPDGFPVVVRGWLDRPGLEDLFANRVAAVRVPGFVSDETCRRAVARIAEHRAFEGQDAGSPIRWAGITQFESHPHPDHKARYFRQVASATRRRREILGGAPDLVDDFIDALRAAWNAPAGLATEGDSGSGYFAGLIRVVRYVPLHYDWAPLDASGWTVGRVRAQLAWNVYLGVGTGGGSLVVHDRFWTPDVESHRVPGSYGYERRVVDGCAAARVTPGQGELVLFNSRNLHEVEVNEGPGERVAVTSFVGLLPSGDLVLWS